MSIPMPAKPPKHANTFATAGVLLAVLLSVAGALESYRAESDYQEAHRDRYLVSAQSPTFAPLLAMVPVDAEVGYLTDAQPGSDADASLFLSAQYLMAPRILARDTAHDWVLGNFGKPADFAAIGAARGLRLERDFGDGLVLFRKGR
jgi:hypothetical protein